MKKTLWLIAALAVTMFACKPDQPTPTPVNPSDTIPPVELKGVFVLKQSRNDD